MADYRSLAQLSKPQQPAGVMPSFYGGIQYGREMDQHQRYLGMAEEEASMGMERQGMENEEFSLAAPGRRAAIETKNFNAQTTLEDARSPETAKLRIAKKVADLAEQERKELEDKAHIFGHLSKAKPEEVQDILSLYGNSAVFKGKDLRQLPPDKAIVLAQGIVEGLKTTPKYLAAMDKQRLQNQGYAATAQTKARSAERVAEIQARSRETAAAIGAASKERLASLKPVDLEKFIVLKMKELEEAGATPTEILEAVEPLMKQLEKIKRRPEAPNTGINALFPNRGGTPPAPAPSPQSKATTPKSVNVGGKNYNVTKDNGDGTVMVDVNGTQRKVKIKQ